MALIKCPECSHEVSSLAKSCPNCGCPLVNKDEGTFDLVLLGCGRARLGTIKELRNSRTLSLNEAVSLVDNVPSTIFSNLQYDAAVKMKDKFDSIGAKTELVKSGEDISYLKIKYSESGLECPKCHSGCVTTGSRGVSSFWGFIGAEQTVNRCGKCGYSWKP